MDTSTLVPGLTLLVASLALAGMLVYLLDRYAAGLEPPTPASPRPMVVMTIDDLPPAPTIMLNDPEYWRSASEGAGFAISGVSDAVFASVTRATLFQLSIADSDDCARLHGWLRGALGARDWVQP